MRLIDADALVEKFKAWAEEAEQKNANINYVFAVASMATVKAEPTIEEGKTGKWIRTGTSIGGVCSECGQECGSVEFSVFGLTPMWKYCPNCGAKMEGVINEDD